MKFASVIEAKTHLFAFVRLAENGERITITRDGKAVAELRASSAGRRPFGIDEGEIRRALPESNIDSNFLAAESYEYH